MLSRLCLTVSLFFASAVFITTSASANECRAYGASMLSEGWNWHYPRETPTIRNGNRKLVCRNGRHGWLYTRDDIAGQYFVADTNWRKQTRTHSNPCDAVAQYCAQ
ncbi:hypothetical protein [uncultured Cohaesibacter sp.]|uniref:hypothetical protein n=1 Tax=uncultured Cohaesibacter sp. TaxID=1002546 RepID=UPI0029C6A87E|nr:hypothetical protein [uncultured Cohaesibacter sp.]